jgi:hypothetical protein
MNNEDRFEKFLKKYRPTPKTKSNDNEARIIWAQITLNGNFKRSFGRIFKYALVPAMSLALILSLLIGYNIKKENELYSELARNLENTFSLSFLKSREDDVVNDLISFTENYDEPHANDDPEKSGS